MAERNRRRQTVPVALLVERANARLAARSESNPGGPGGLEGMTPEQAFRAGVASLVGTLLHDAGQYRGYGFQDSEFRPDWNSPENRAAEVSPLRDGYDDTRRIYYL